MITLKVPRFRARLSEREEEWRTHFAAQILKTKQHYETMIVALESQPETGCALTV